MPNIIGRIKKSGLKQLKKNKKSMNKYDKITKKASDSIQKEKQRRREILDKHYNDLKTVGMRSAQAFVNALLWTEKDPRFFQSLKDESKAVNKQINSQTAHNEASKAYEQAKKNEKLYRDKQIKQTIDEGKRFIVNLFK